jgi:RNA polymerase sigma-70 factor, ECF subfamily
VPSRSSPCVWTQADLAWDRMAAVTRQSSSSITRLLKAWGGGDHAAFEKLVPVVDAELRRLARRYMRGERMGHTLQPTALINELYLRLIDWGNISWQDRAHFFGLSARLMRRTLVDHARRHRTGKRGRDVQTIAFNEAAVVPQERTADLVAIDDALNALTVRDPRKSQIIELRFFGGLTVEETAEVLKISPRTVKREWSLARAWLYCELTEEKAPGV